MLHLWRIMNRPDTFSPFLKNFKFLFSFSHQFFEYLSTYAFDFLHVSGTREEKIILSFAEKSTNFHVRPLCDPALFDSYSFHGFFDDL